MAKNTRTQKQISAGSAVRSFGVTAPKAPVCTTAPTITGTSQVGQTLTRVAAVWSGSPTTIVLQWIRQSASGDSAGEVAIPGATGSTYVPTSADVGYRLSVNERAVNAQGYSRARSAPTAIVIP